MQARSLNIVELHMPAQPKGDVRFDAYIVVYMAAGIIILSFTENVYMPSRKANKTIASILFLLFKHLVFLNVSPERGMAGNVGK